MTHYVVTVKKGTDIDAFYNDMDEENKQAMDILTSEGPEAAIKFMTIEV